MAASSQTGFGTAAADSFLIYDRSFTSASPVWWDAADGGSPISPAFQRLASWDRYEALYPCPSIVVVHTSLGSFFFLKTDVKFSYHFSDVVSVFTTFIDERSENRELFCCVTLSYSVEALILMHAFSLCYFTIFLSFCYSCVSACCCLV